MELISEKKIQEIVNKISKHYFPEKIILFGSYAKGNPELSSDLDLFIIKDSALPRYKRSIEVRRLLFGSMIPIDLLIYTPKEIENQKDRKYSFVREVLNTGRVVYER
ncbi:MAG: nucleotidyltransferase domain-containing protein [Leptospiraceae bacterium]|jgi:predicted nucleotidyltransferase|nr:nucleotidyltransferase domain-containing protein [Leptospiraceae bacterium]MBK7058618.1 nucleotidyltransferase domain-containing protein [Leptospiraceae bacterium]MBK9498538.1 nucleotidyltransferase domain-containing protein [Leptospiraceae bacterium]MBL0262926.1 nucleotidyltransferase domain-containing protein [Leptospiraceae bacterium]